MASKDYPLNVAIHDGTRWHARTWLRQITTHAKGSLSGTLRLPICLLVAAGAALVLDVQVSRWCINTDFSRDLEQFLRIGETYCHGFGVLVIAIAVHQLDRPRRTYAPHVALVGWCAGLMANVVKLMVARVRPHGFDFQGDVWSTFAGVFPFLSGGSPAQSFPSAHVAAAAGLTVVLSRLYPQARWFFIGLAVMAACQRIQCGAHYVSDTLVGAALGMIFARAILNTKWFAIPPLCPR